MKHLAMALLTFIVAFIISVFFTLTVFAQNLEEEVDCLSEALYFESSKFPNTFCGVVHQANKTKNGKLIKHKCQFSYYCDGKEETFYNGLAYEKVVKIAYLVLEDVSVEFLGEALYYHAVYVNPSWAKHKKYLGRAGLHKFYK